MSEPGTVEAAISHLPPKTAMIAAIEGGLVLSGLPARGEVEETRDTPRGLSHRVINAITGPNGKDGTLVTCWLIEDRAGTSVPRLVTTWAQPHLDKEAAQ